MIDVVFIIVSLTIAVIGGWLCIAAIVLLWPQVEEQPELTMPIMYALVALLSVFGFLFAVMFFA